MRTGEDVMWLEVADSFAEALAAPDRPMPGVLAGDPARFAVYRNNVAVGLRDALAATYPVVGALVGDAFFAEMARAFTAAEPPTSSVLIEYGAGFADFIDAFRPARDLSYLSGVARLEWAWQEAYHAADAGPVDIQILADVGADEMDNVRIMLHPSVRLIRSQWPVVSIWEAHQQDVADLSAVAALAENALIVRPRLAVAVHSLDAGAFDMVGMLARGEPLGRVIGRLSAHHQGTDFSACLAGLFGAGAVVGIR